MVKNPVGDYIKKYLSDNKLSQEWLAGKINCSQPQANRLLNGKIKWKQYQLELASKAVGVSIDNFLKSPSPDNHAVPIFNHQNEILVALAKDPKNKVRWANWGVWTLEIEKEYPSFPQTIENLFELYRSNDIMSIGLVENGLQILIRKDRRIGDERKIKRKPSGK